MFRSHPGRPAEAASAWSFALLVLSACALDSTGHEPAGAASTGATTTATGAATTTTADTSSGNGAGPTTSGGGDGASGTTTGGGSSSNGGSGGDGGGGRRGDGGGGRGGDGGGGRGGDGGGGRGGDGGGGEGGGGVIDEWLLRVHANNNQTVNDVASSIDGAFVYIVGTARDDQTSIDGDDPTIDPDSDDVFVAKIAADGSQVAWFEKYGGPGEDRGLSIAVARDPSGGNERVYVGGVAQGTNVGPDLFVPNTVPPANEWGFVMEIDPNSGTVNGGTLWGRVDLNGVVDVTTIAGKALAVGTCLTPCADSVGTPSQADDVIVARWPVEVDDVWASRVVSRGGNQRGIAIAAKPAANGFFILGEMADAAYDPNLGVAGSTCTIASHGGVDAFVASYDFGAIDYACTNAIALGSTQGDEAHSLATDGETAFVGMLVKTDDGVLGEDGAHVVTTTNGVFGTSIFLSNANNSGALALVVDAEYLGIGGRIDDDGFVQRLLLADDSLGARRDFTGNLSQVRGLALTPGGYFVGGVFDGTVAFGGTIPDQTAQALRDGFVGRVARP